MQSFLKSVRWLAIALFLIPAMGAYPPPAVGAANLNCDEKISLADAIVALQVAADIEPASFCFDDANADGRIDATEAVFALRSTARGDALQSSRLKVTVKENRTSQEPVPGVYVILHKTDNTSIERVKITDQNGVADFGDIGRSRATFTIAQLTEVENHPHRYAWTFVETRVGDLVHYGLHVPDPPITEASVTATDAPSESLLVLQPFEWEGYFQEGSPLTVEIAPEEEQTDGTVSMLVEAKEMNQMTQDPANALLEYGFLLDQPVHSGTSYSVSLDHESPATVSWNVQTPTPISGISVSGKRKGVSYEWAYPGKDQSQGTFTYADGFPLDSWWVTLTSGDLKNPDATFLGLERKYSAIPSNLSVSLPDMEISDFTYDSSDQVYSWNCSGTMARDVVNLNIHNNQPETEESRYVHWTVQMPGDRNSWNRVDLPQAIGSDFEMDWQKNFVNVMELDAFSDYNELMAAYYAGHNRRDLASRIQSARKSNVP